jgi:carnosine N-methyltransferase
MRRVARAHENFSCLPLHHQQLLNDFLPNLDRLKAAIDTNHQFIDRLMKSAQGMFVNSSVADALPRPVDDSDRSGPTGCVPSSFDMEKVKTTIKQFFRDWSAEVTAAFVVSLLSLMPFHVHATVLSTGGQDWVD